LREALASRWPFLLAAGGPLAADVRPWLDAGVDASHLGPRRQGLVKRVRGGWLQVLEILPGLDTRRRAFSKSPKYQARASKAANEVQGRKCELSKRRLQR